MRDFDVQETESGTVYSTQKIAVYVFDTVDDPRQAANDAALRNRDNPSGTVRIEPAQGDPRSHTERAMLLALLIDQVGPLQYSYSDVNTDSPQTARVPVRVAAAGKPAIACYLAVHRLSNDEIADLLDVSDRTVTQYISDFKKGER